MIAEAEMLVTTIWILAEVGNSMRFGADRVPFATFVQRLLGAPQIEVMPASNEWFRRGMALFEQRPDKEWSLTDCISFAVMRERGITEALTADHHFEQAGFSHPAEGMSWGMNEARGLARTPSPPAAWSRATPHPETPLDEIC